MAVKGNEPFTTIKYIPEFKRQAVELVRLRKSVSEVARELNIGDGFLYAWVKNIE